MKRSKHVHFEGGAKETGSGTAVGNAVSSQLREWEEREMEESIMLRPFSDVLQEEFSASTLEAFMIWRAAENPLCIREWLVNSLTGGRDGIVRYLRDQMFPIVREDVFTSWKSLLLANRPEDLFWSFVCALTLDEGVQNLVATTWKGSARSLECVMDYLQCAFVELLESPFDPENANSITVGLWGLVRADIVPMNMRSIILKGKLKPVVVPLSRNAHRLRKQEIRQAEEEEEFASVDLLGRDG